MGNIDKREYVEEKLHDQFVNGGIEMATLKTANAFKPNEIFIKAEDQGVISYPSGIEIARMKISVK